MKSNPQVVAFVTPSSLDIDEPSLLPERLRILISRVNWKLLVPLVAGTLVVGGVGVYWLANRATPPRYVTTVAALGDVVTTITASGSVNPVVVVSVGTYVSGTIATLSCDYNTRVKKGQLCAKIDPKPYQVVVDQDQADLDVAKAQRQRPGQCGLYENQSRAPGSSVQAGLNLSRCRRHCSQCL